MLLSWSDTYKIGNKTIDSHHMKLFALVNDLDQSHDATELKEAFLTLYRFTRDHFNTEEQLMDAHCYPDSAAHKRKHEELLGQLSIVAAQPIDENHRYSTFRNFMTKWLVDHIEKDDTKLQSFIES